MKIPDDCLFCGVCCYSKSGAYVRVSESDWLRLGDDAERVARHVGKEAYMRMEEGHCIALRVTNHRGQPPQFFCEIYEKRPQVCRDLARGKAACQTELRAKAERVAASVAQ